MEAFRHRGHSPGSVCYQVRGAEGTYLFTGDTLYVSDTREWAAGFIPGIGDADALASSLQLLATLEPDVVISSAFQGDIGGAPHRRATTGPAHVAPGCFTGLRRFSEPLTRGTHQACQ